MKLAPFETLHLSDSANSRMQDNLIKYMNQLNAINFLNGNMITVGVTTSAQKFEHKLGAKPSGYIVLGQNAAASIFCPVSDDMFITFEASATVSANIWVF